MLALANFDWSKLTESGKLEVILRVAVLVLAGLPLLHLASAVAGKLMRKRFSEQAGMLVRKGVLYAGFVILSITVLNQLGFKLTALLGAAGIAGIAIGFAAQTSVSNVISGLFLISEKPFAIGDVISVGDKLGFVLSIDLLSVKVRTFDNRYVRIPNESLIKTEVINLTRFPIRRLDVNVGVAYKEDVNKVREVLFDLARKNPHCLDDPEPVVRFVNFGDSALEFLFGLWCVKEDYFLLQDMIMEEIKERFDAEGIEIPFPHRTVYTGEVTKPFPIQLVGPSEPPDAKEQ